MIQSLLVALACCVCFVLCDFENTFNDYSFNFPDRYNPIIGALLVESNFLLRAYLYGKKEQPFVECVRNIFEISDPNSTSAADFNVKKSVKIGIDKILHYLNATSLNKSDFDTLLRGCRYDANNSDSAILWAAFYQSNARDIFKKTFEYIARKIIKVKSSLPTGLLRDIIYLVKNHSGVPIAQVQSTQYLHGANSASFRNCVESTALEMINLGMLSNPQLKLRLESSFQSFPHWSTDLMFRHDFFISIKQPSLIKAGAQAVKDVYRNIFVDISKNINVKENWAKLSQDLPRLSYGNFYIVKTKTKCPKIANTLVQFVKVEQVLFDSLQGEIVPSPLLQNGCSDIKFKRLKNNKDIYLTTDQGIILYELRSVLRNFEGIFKYFFQLKFSDNFKVDQTEAESFANLLKLFKNYFLFTIKSAKNSKDISEFRFEFKRFCSGTLTVKTCKHSFASDFQCATNQQILETFHRAVSLAVSPNMKQAIEFFNVKNKFEDLNTIEVFANKQFDHIFKSSLVDMARVFHYCEKSEDTFFEFYDEINEFKQVASEHSDLYEVDKVKEHLMEIFKDNFIMQMNLRESTQVFIKLVKITPDLELVDFFIKNINLDFDTAVKEISKFGYVAVIELIFLVKKDQIKLPIIALENAAGEDHLDIVQCSISQLRKLATTDQIAIVINRALAAAASNNYEAIFEYLLSLYKEFPGITVTYDNNAAIINASKNNNYKILEIMVDNLRKRNMLVGDVKKMLLGRRGIFV